MKVLRSIIMIALLMVIAAYGVKIYQRATGKTVNVSLIFDVLWNKASKTADIIETKVKDSSENLTFKMDNGEHQSKIGQIVNNDINEKIVQKKKPAEIDVPVAGGKNLTPIRNPQVQESSAELKSPGKGNPNESGIDPLDAEDRKITEDVFSGLFPNDAETIGEPVPEPMSLEQATKISNIHQEVWEILQ